jgi:hypothetical protein
MCALCCECELSLSYFLKDNDSNNSNYVSPQTGLDNRLQGYAAMLCSCDWQRCMAIKIFDIGDWFFFYSRKPFHNTAQVLLLLAFGRKRSSVK